MSRVLHAGYLIEFERSRVLFDPIFENPFSRNCYAFPDVQFDLETIQNLHVDAVLISHFHDDHCSLDSLMLLPKTTPIYLYCLEESLFDWIRQLGFKQVFPIVLDQTLEFGSLKVTAKAALDVSVDSVFHIQGGDFHVLNVVDSWIPPETFDYLLAIKKWDLVLWPFQTLRELEVLSPYRAKVSDRKLPMEWLEQIQLLQPKAIVPSSCQFIHEPWSWYNQELFPISYQIFSDEVLKMAPECQVIRLDPSKQLRLGKERHSFIEPLSWVQMKSQVLVDYEYAPLKKYPGIDEVAKNLKCETEAQKNFIFNYCQNSLKEQFEMIGPSSARFFNAARVWNLKVYGNQEELSFWYLLDGEKLTSLESISDQVEWLTEIPLVKLFSALTEGESLTSLYIRVNGIQFSEKLEKEIQDVDVVEDPLIRILSGYNFGAYQKEQLKKILSY